MKQIGIMISISFLVFAAATHAETIRVRDGESIAKAIKRASPGTVIEVEPGIYQEALVVDVPNLTLRGIVEGPRRPVLDGAISAEKMLADGVIVSGSPFTMTGFQVQNYAGNGVTTQGIDGVYISDLIVKDTGLYGIYPIQARNIVVTHCRISGMRDAGIYVGQSNHARIAFNETHHNVVGIQLENTNDAEVTGNLVHRNTLGIYAVVLPGKVQKTGARATISNNWVTDNNTKNFGDSFSFIGAIPHGAGIVVTGADDIEIHGNRIRGHRSVGIVVGRLPLLYSKKDQAIEPLSNRVHIRNNHLAENGEAPHPKALLFYGGVGSIAWDGHGEGHCIAASLSKRQTGKPMPHCADDEESGGHEMPPTSPPPKATAPTATSDLRGDVEVRIRAMRYEPREIRIKIGQSVVWINDDAVSHTVTSGEGTEPSFAPLRSGFLNRGDRYAHRFEQPGTYEYLCLPHVDQASMRGAKVIVDAP